MMNDSEKDLLEHIGKVIKIKRRKKNYSQTSLAESLHIEQAVISRYEHGKVNVPVLTLKGIADECDFSMIDYFIEVEYDAPSTMLKRIVNPHSSAGLRTKSDKEFDDYILKPQNKQKYEMLYHASQLVDLAPQFAESNLILDIQRSLTQDEKDSGFAERMSEYMHRLKDMQT